MRAAALLAVVVLAACGSGSGSSASSSSSASTMAIDGTVVLSGYAGTSGPCTGTGGFDDIHGGAAVTVTDETGTIVATTELQPGELGLAQRCAFGFLAKVPTGKAFYSFEVSHRGKVTYSADQLRQMANRVDLTL